ncbi:MAG: hypothetical protein SVM80_13740, partial [Halobacteriota archaeon]|nr:hypothetical protein [Halobacteriota archaeon]
CARLSAALRRAHIYSENDQVMILDQPNRKFGDDMYKGPFTITKVNDNGTICVRKPTASGNAVIQTWNVRNVRPYYKADPLP